MRSLYASPKIHVIQAGRGAGKTYNMMTAVHEYVQAHSWEGVVIVVPDHRMVHWWVRSWQERFPFLSVPNVLSVRSLDRVRGTRLRRVYIEDVDRFEDGIYDQSLEMVWFALRGDDSEVYVTSSLNRLNDAAHTPYEIVVERRQAEYEEWRRLDDALEREELGEIEMMLHIIHSINKPTLYDQDSE